MEIVKEAYAFDEEADCLFGIPKFLCNIKKAI
jgi:hypothetical protein